MHRNPLEGLLTCRLLGPTPSDSDLAGLGYDLISYISNKCPDAAAGEETIYSKNCCSLGETLAEEGAGGLEREWENTSRREVDWFKKKHSPY